MGQLEEVLRPHGLSGGRVTAGGQGSWSASHVVAAAELGHRRLATKAESHPSSRQDGGGQGRALGGAGPKSREKARKQGCWNETGRGDWETIEVQGAGGEKIEKFHSFIHSFN